MAHPTLVKQLIGVVSQTNTLDRQLTVAENLYFHGRLFGIGAAESRQTADELLESFQLSRWAKASVYALSGGMAQRLMVARSIFHRPAVLFLDEPTAGLDPQSRLALWDILGRAERGGQTIMLTTHYMEEADKLCDRVAIMDHGKILALDTPAELKQGVGADTIVTVKAAVTRACSPMRSGAACRGSPGPARPTQGSSCTSVARSRLLAPGRRRGRGERLRARRPVRRRADPRDRVHQPDREGAPRLMATTTARIRRARSRRHPARPGAALAAEPRGVARP